MRGGRLRNVINIEQRTQTGTNEQNESVHSWTVWRTVFCEKLARRGTEHFDQESKQRYSQVVFRFACRYSDVDGVDTADMRIEHEGQKYDIRGILPDDQRRDECVIEATLQDGTS